MLKEADGLTTTLAVLLLLIVLLHPPDAILVIVIVVVPGFNVDVVKVPVLLTEEKFIVAVAFVAEVAPDKLYVTVYELEVANEVDRNVTTEVDAPQNGPVADAALVKA
jgi:hypothetical protein